MIGQESKETERKVSAILRVLKDSSEPLGGRVISRRLKEQGVNLGERAVRYHLKIMDERGLTRIAGNRDGRSITRPGIEELSSALVWDKLGLLAYKIELLSYLTSFNSEYTSGNVPIDLSLFPASEFDKAMAIMEKIFKADFCTSDLVAIGTGGDRLGEIVIPEGQVGLATVSSIAINGSLLKAGIPIEPRFGGVLQIKNYDPVRFVDLIEFQGSTVDPGEVFIAGALTGVAGASKSGTGKVLASYHEIPMLSRPEAETVIKKLQEAGLCKAYVIGRANESICEVPVKPNRVGMILFGGLNPAAAAVEAGINVTCKAMSGVVNMERLQSIRDL